MPMKYFNWKFNFTGCEHENKLPHRHHISEPDMLWPNSTTRGFNDNDEGGHGFEEKKHHQQVQRYTHNIKDSAEVNVLEVGGVAKHCWSCLQLERTNEWANLTLKRLRSKHASSSNFISSKLNDENNPADPDFCSFFSKTSHVLQAFLYVMTMAPYVWGNQLVVSIF